MGTIDSVSGKAFINGTLRKAKITIEDGSIKNIVEQNDVPDVMILPGFIDPHVHFRDPGMTEKEDFSTGSLAAVHAGVTCVLDMPNTIPNVISCKELESKSAAISKRSYADFGLFAGLTPEFDIEGMDRAIGFKMFMGSTTGNMLMNDDRHISEVFGRIRHMDKTVSVHAEDDDLLKKNKENDNIDHLMNRPAEAETNAIRRLSKHQGMRINICHVSTAAGAELAECCGFTTEVTMHHILLDSSRNGAMYKVNPPLRSADEREHLLSMFINGRMTMFGSDHAPHTDIEKSGDYGKAPSGISGVEVTMPMVMAMVRKNIIPLQLAVRMGSLMPADLFGLNKGMIKEGYDADFAVFNMDDKTTIRSSGLHGKVKHSVYEGFDAVFPETVVVRGNIQIDDGAFIGKKIGADVGGSDWR